MPAGRSDVEGPYSRKHVDPRDPWTSSPCSYFYATSPRLLLGVYHTSIGRPLHCCWTSIGLVLVRLAHSFIALPLGFYWTSAGRPLELDWTSSGLLLDSATT